MADGAGVLGNPSAEQLDGNLGCKALRPATECADDQGFRPVRGGNAQQRLHARCKCGGNLALAAVVLQRARTIRLGDGQHVGVADIAVAHERHVGQVQRAVGEQLARGEPAVAVVVEGLAALQHRVEVAFRAQDLLGAERAVLVRAAGTRERARVDDHGLPLGAAQRLRGEIAGDGRGRYGAFLNFGQGEVASLAVLVDAGGVDGGLGFLGERAAHEREVLACVGLTVFAGWHGHLLGAKRLMP